MQNSNNAIRANCRVSRPILYPDHQHVLMNGFAFSRTKGMLHQINSNNNPDWTTWLGTQN